MGRDYGVGHGTGDGRNTRELHFSKGSECRSLCDCDVTDTSHGCSARSAFQLPSCQQTQPAQFAATAVNPAVQIHTSSASVSVSVLVQGYRVKPPSYLFVRLPTALLHQHLQLQLPSVLIRVQERQFLIMSAPVIPPGGTIVQTFKQSFVDVPLDADKGNAVATTQFLDAVESLATIFGAFSGATNSIFYHEIGAP